MAQPLERLSRLPNIEAGTTSLTWPSLGQWTIHVALFAATILSTTLAGVFFVAAPQFEVSEPPLSTAFDYLHYVPVYYFQTVVGLVQATIKDSAALTQGLQFSTSLVAILTAHELGHYIACRRYGVRATLPFFIPAPPLFLAGTFGAFIKIQSPIPSRRALIDIGLAGPIAGFIVAIPVSILGILSLEPAEYVSGHAIIFNDPLLFRLIAIATNTPLNAESTLNPFYMAAWIGLLVTSLNLMPVGQLDGGHGTFALFGQKAHHVIGWVAFVTTGVLGLLGWFWHASLSGLLYTVLLGVMIRVRHPPPLVNERLGMSRVVLGVITLVVFALSFWPFPLTIT